MARGVSDVAGSCDDIAGQAAFQREVVALGVGNFEGRIRSAQLQVGHIGGKAFAHDIGEASGQTDGVIRAAVGIATFGWERSCVLERIIFASVWVVSRALCATIEDTESRANRRLLIR